MKNGTYVYETTFSGTVSDQQQEHKQLFAASSLRKALVKSEKYLDATEKAGGEILSIQKRGDVVI